MTMQPSIFRRNYYLIRVHSRDQFRKDQNRERQIYSQTARVVNEMINHIKNLLLKVNSFKQELEMLSQQKDQSSDGQDCQDVMQRFKQFQKQIPLTFFSQYPLDNKMLGAFVMRMGKQINYWAKPLPYLFQIVSDIDKVFQEQKNNQNQNISLIYFITVKKLINQTNQFFKKIKFNQVKLKYSMKQVQAKITIIQPQQIHVQNIANQIKVALSCIYRDLDIELEPSVYKFASKELENVELLCKKQIRRNKKIRKEIKAYRIAYQIYKDKKTKESLKKKGRTFSNVNLKNCVNKSNSKTKTKDSSNANIVFPSINTSQQRMPRISKKTRDENKCSQLSFQKNKKKINGVKINKVQLKLKL